jgi:predicted nucleic acid-binding protein
MHAFDASSILHAWDNYPEDQFPPLWDWIALQIADRQFVISEVALDETTWKAPDCGAWLTNQGIEVLPLTPQVLDRAMAIQHLLGIRDDKYNPKGVDENDLLIIATALTKGLILVSDEGRQFKLPDKMEKYKIPAVCDLPAVNVKCISFLELIRASGAIFAR